MTVPTNNEAGMFAIAQATPSVVITARDGRELLRIDPDGTVTGTVEDASEAARVFVRELGLAARRLPVSGDNAELIATARRIIFTKDGTRVRTDYSLAGHLLAALEASQPREVEVGWEYGVVGPTGHMVNNGDYTREQTHRRIKAGPWLPVTPSTPNQQGAEQ